MLQSAARIRRVVKAYHVTAIVLGSYLWLAAVGKFRSKNWREKRLRQLHARNAERVRDAILDLKGLFIKLGQILSVLGNFLPEEFQRPLESLQDQVPPRPLDQVRQRILDELGQPPETIFQYFDETPLAAASIGQAHRARLPDGTEVVVKVQHLDVEEIASLDLEIIRRLVRIHSWFFDIRGMDYMYSQVKKMIEEELDFAREANALETIGKNLADEPGIVLPAVHREFSTSRVLTLTWHEGVKISNLQQLDDWGLDRRELATRLLRAYCQMFFRDGHYHADPHPGNILVKPDGTLVLLDFGAVAEVSDALREGIPMLLEAAVRNDTPGMVKAFQRIGFLAEGREAEKMAGRMLGAARNFFQNEVEFEGMNFKEIRFNPLNNSLLNLVQEVGMSRITGAVQVPKDYVLLNRMLALLLGLCHALDPTLNPLDVVRPYAKDFVLGQRGSWFKFAGRLIQESATTLLGLPGEVHHTLELARRGELELALPDLKASARLVYLGTQQVLFAVLGALGVGAALFFERENWLVLGGVAWVAAGFFGWHFGGVIRAGGKLRRELEG